MHLFLFLDDWMLDGYQDIVRRFPHPIPATVPLWEDAHNHATVIRDPETGLYRCWYRRFYGNGGDNRAALCVAESVDGYHWQPLNHQGPKDPGLPGRSNTLDIPQRPDGSGQARVHVVFRDDSDPDASRRYKGVDYYGWLLFSPDGIRWRIDPACQAFKIASGSDTKNNLFWNPVKKQYQVHHRPVNVDRRVALSTSPDLKNWNYEGIVFQPDAMDPPLLEIYSMVTFWYEDIFIAFPDLFRTPMGETGRRWKMLGHNQVGLAYSYNGTYWLRPYHDPFLPIGEPGTFGGGINGPGSMVLGDDQVLRIYTTGYKPQHNQGNAYQQYRASGQEYGAMLIYNLRKDGFAYLEPMGGWGWVKTKTLLPQDGQLELNIQAPLGEVLVQVSDEASEPIPGFTFEDAIPIQGDGVAIRPQWKEHRLDELTGKPCRLEFKLFSARLFAYRWNCQVYYAKEAQDRV